MSQNTYNHNLHTTHIILCITVVSSSCHFCALHQLIWVVLWRGFITWGALCLFPAHSGGAPWG